MFDFFLDYTFIDKDIILALSSIYSSVLLGPTLAEKKAFSKKVMLLNNAGLVFGFEIILDKAKNCTSLKMFRELLDFSISLYPNHIFFDDSSLSQTASLSKNDIMLIKRSIFACNTYYSLGRAVPWFSAVLFPLRIRPSFFFSDFAEWQECNNCSFSDGFDPNTADHCDIETMQALFLKLKYEEKKLMHLYAAAVDLLKIHGAFSRVLVSGKKTQIELSYHPDDILSPCAMDIARFCDEVCMEPSRVEVFLTDEGPDYTPVS